MDTKLKTPQACLEKLRNLVGDRLSLSESVLEQLVGHVGDGNFHLSFLIDPEDSDELERANAVNHRMVNRAIELGGTCTGEHGIGYGKLKYMEKEHGESLAVMAAIKQTLDPNNLMNPGKMIPSV